MSSVLDSGGGVIRVVLFLFIICFFTSSNGKSFQVFRITPENQRQLDILNFIYENAHNYSLDFWKTPTKIGTFVDMMLPQKMIRSITALLAANKISYNVTISDVTKLMREQESSVKRNSPSFGAELASFFRRFNDESSKNKAKYNFKEYGSYSQMTAWMKNVQAHYPLFTKVFQIGTTHEGRSIEGIKIGSPIHDTKKRAIWIDGGIHAREWAAMHSALYFINELVSNYGWDPEITNYVDSLNFFIVPCLNPDGYDFSFSATDDPWQYGLSSELLYQRFWRKNRSKRLCPSNSPSDPKKQVYCCRGVDLNRNFDFHWGETGSSSNPCAYNYHGSSAFSEPETRAVRDMFLSPELYGKTDAFITLHTYAQLWMYPWGHRPDSYPEDIADMKIVAETAAEALRSSYGTKYKTGTGADLLYSAAGASSDWAKKSANVKYAYVLELRPALAMNGYILNKNELIPTVKETWAGVRVVIDAVLRLNGLQRKIT